MPKENEIFMKKFFVLAGILLAIQVSGQTVSQQVGLKKGDKFKSVNKMEIVITQEVMGQVMEVFVNSNTTNSVDIKENNSNGIKLTSSLTHFKMDVDAMGQEINMDSENQDQGGEFSKLLNVPNDYSLDKSGKITEVKKNTPDIEAGGMGDMGSMGEVEKVGEVFSLIANVPAKGVKVGDSWTDSTEADGVKSVNKYVLKEVKDGIGTVEFNTDLKMSRQMQQQGMDMFMNLSGKGTGQYSFDVKTGIIRSKTLNTNASGTVDVMGQQIPMSIETKLLNENQKN